MEGNESTDHVVSVCSKLAQKEYQRRHDSLVEIVHWELASVMLKLQISGMSTEQKEF